MAEQNVPNEFRFDCFHKYFYSQRHQFGTPVRLDTAQVAKAIRTAMDAGTMAITEDNSIEYIKLDAYPSSKSEAEHG